MSQSDVPIDTLPIWSRFNGVVFDGAAIAQTEGKGYGLVAQRDLQAEDGEKVTVLLSVPQELLLNSESVDQYSRTDQRFKDLFDVAGHQSPRQNLILFLLAQIIHVWASDEGGGVSNPWTQYIKYLPRTVPLPTLWNEDERQLLRGTSLEAAVHSKLRALENEFDDLLEKAAEIPSWNEVLCENQVITVSDYARLDAWYRSRCMELPASGPTMVPCIDMVNHAATPNASYVKNSEDGVNLCLRPGAAVEIGQEITISYGEKKPAAEMLFSYGFVDSEAAGDEKILVPVEPPEDDPLVMAKARIYGEAPTVRISRSQDGGVQWDCPFAFLLSLNEEDGLGIRLLQLNDGGREIRLFWEEQDVTGSVKSLQDITKEHPHHKVFQLRTVVIVQETVQAQLKRLSTGTGDHNNTANVRPSCRFAAQKLREAEERLLQDAADVLETEKTQLLENEKILAYLGRTEVAQNDLADSSPANEETDFS
ncbi:hypothetical protein MCOR25_002484 [Pyricularia grisea]|uniref:SET domain-containing protein n=1 Tax=Pyricularia grisea TaxID=148305 RepID=A0A6P8B133_PYRGI|nr:uncharacterized protein PgNI_06796 [Pyricularia grisea]KAI6377502.1 hypothetical protein MCOR25_002484 [Pyricularia grisea]TLD08541.1 hypothetical protein PgNI_06796 [Pyricularia grisea]